MKLPKLLLLALLSFHLSERSFCEDKKSQSFEDLFFLEETENESFGEEFESVPIPPGFIAEDSKQWIADFDHVEVVLYNSEVPSPGDFLVHEGKFHKGLAEAWTQRLTAEQIDVLVSAITGKHQPVGGALCYIPHHGFVFYDKDSKILGHVEICFMCGNYYSMPRKGLSRDWDLSKLGTLVRELGLPMFNSPDKWKTFFADKEMLASGPEKPNEQTETDASPAK